MPRIETRAQVQAARAVAREALAPLADDQFRGGADGVEDDGAAFVLVTHATTLELVPDTAAAAASIGEMRVELSCRSDDGTECARGLAQPFVTLADSVLHGHGASMRSTVRGPLGGLTRALGLDHEAQFALRDGRRADGELDAPASAASTIAAQEVAYIRKRATRLVGRDMHRSQSRSGRALLTNVDDGQAFADVEAASGELCGEFAVDKLRVPQGPVAAGEACIELGNRNSTVWAQYSFMLEHTLLDRELGWNKVESDGRFELRDATNDDGAERYAANGGVALSVAEFPERTLWTRAPQFGVELFDDAHTGQVRVNASMSNWAGAPWAQLVVDLEPRGADVPER